MTSPAEYRGEWALPRVLEARAEMCGDRHFVDMVDGPSISFSELSNAASRVASMLREAGIEPGDRVAVMLPNGLDFLRAWSGIGRLGAIMVALNTELVGPFLAHQLEDCDAGMIIVDVGLTDLVERHRPPAMEVMVSSGSFDEWKHHPLYRGAMPGPSDIACVMYTSGTTGPAKGVLMPHAHAFLFGLGTIENLGLGPDDHYYVTLPLFHANGLFMQIGAALIAGATATLRPRFSASAWLDDVRRTRATITNLLGATSAFILAQPEAPTDRDHRLRLIAAAPNPTDHDRQWRQRFGITDVIGLYGMTEVNIPLYGERGVAKPGSCGRPYSRFFEVEIRDPVTDAPVPVGAAGEIMVRPRIPFGFMAGYHGLPDKTVEAWRNFWFHTGDAGSMDADGYVYFHDRIKDCIRRRGENISSFQLESAIGTLAGVEEVAAVAVPADFAGGEDEIMLFVVANAKDLSPQRVAEHARDILPRFAQPRFIELVSELPRTSTGKVRKAALRHRGPSPDSWQERDRADP